MRSLTVVATLAAAAALVVPAGAATPHPSSCTPVAHGAVVPANPANLVATAAVVVYGGEVTCTRDPLTTPPIDHLTPYVGHLSIELRAANGTILCGGNPNISGAYQSVSSVLVMTNQNTCVVPVTDPNRLQPMYVRIYWATMPPYVCCAAHQVWITPAGIG